MAIKGQSFLKAALLVAASAGLSGCVYDVGLGFAGDGYHDDDYGCDPYGGYDAYYNCDYGHAFSNIGFGGGWYDNYYYPGHGIFLFDIAGRPYPMREQYRRYWSERRHQWYRSHRGRDLGRSRYEGHDTDYKDNPRYERPGSPDRREDRMQDGHDRRTGLRQGSRSGNDEWRSNDGRGARAVQLPNIGGSQDLGRRQDDRDDYRQPDRRGSGAPDRNIAPAPPRTILSKRENAKYGKQLSETRPQHQGPQTTRQRMPEGEEERPG